MDADGSNQQNLTNKPDCFDSNPAWSPDGRLGFKSASSYGAGLFIMNADGTGIQPIRDATTFAYSAWSPDGKRIAFSHAPDPTTSTREIFVCDANGTNLRQLTTLGTLNVFAAWSPDGTSIAFQHYSEYPESPSTQPIPPGDLYSMDADGRNLKCILHNEGHAWVPGTRIAGGRPAWKPTPPAEK